MKRVLLLLLVCGFAVGAVFANGGGDSSDSSSGADEMAKPIKWKYAHMNAEDNQAGQQAIWFSARVEELTNGGIEIDIYPNSQLGSMVEQVEMTSAGTVQLHHDTWGNMSVLLDELQALDTPYLAKNVDDYLKINDINGPFLPDLNEKLIASSGVRLLGSTYGGSRCLTANFPVYSPDDLKGVKIRAIPAPIYVAAVEGMGAIAVPVDWVDVPAALSTGVVQGQENPPATINAVRFQDLQDYIMDTKHIAAIGPFMVNEAAFQALPKEYQDAVLQASAETVEKFCAQGVAEEAGMIQKLIDDGMTFVTVEDGLDIDAFKAGVDAKVAETFPQYAGFYEDVKEYLGY